MPFSSSDQPAGRQRQPLLDAEEELSVGGLSPLRIHAVAKETLQCAQARAGPGGLNAQPQTALHRCWRHAVPAGRQGIQPAPQVLHQRRMHRRQRRHVRQKIPCPQPPGHGQRAEQSPGQAGQLGMPGQRQMRYAASVRPVLQHGRQVPDPRQGQRSIRQGAGRFADQPWRRDGRAGCQLLQHFLPGNHQLHLPGKTPDCFRPRHQAAPFLPQIFHRQLPGLRPLTHHQTHRHSLAPFPRPVTIRCPFPSALPRKKGMIVESALP